MKLDALVAELVSARTGEKALSAQARKSIANRAGSPSLTSAVTRANAALDSSLALTLADVQALALADSAPASAKAPKAPKASPARDITLASVKSQASSLARASKPAAAVVAAPAHTFVSVNADAMAGLTAAIGYARDMQRVSANMLDALLRTAESLSAPAPVAESEPVVAAPAPATGKASKAAKKAAPAPTQKAATPAPTGDVLADVDARIAAREAAATDDAATLDTLTAMRDEVRGVYSAIVAEIVGKGKTATHARRIAREESGKDDLEATLAEYGYTLTRSWELAPVASASPKA